MKFLNRNICNQIEQLKLKEPSLNYLECVLVVCEENGIEIESAKSIISKNIKEKMEADAAELNLLKTKSNRLV